MKPNECRGCPYYERPGPVWPDGPEDATVLLVGEGPGFEEIREGKGFVGAAGYEMWKLAEVGGLHRADCRVTNVVKCLPAGAGRGNYKLDPLAIAHCKRFLDKELATCQATVRVPVGAVALQALTGETSILRFRGAVLTRNSSRS